MVVVGSPRRGVGGWGGGGAGVGALTPNVYAIYFGGEFNSCSLQQILRSRGINLDFRGRSEGGGIFVLFG